MMQQEKIEQAIAILQELNIDTWLILARETEEMPERAWELVAPSGVVWQGAIFLTPRGDRIAIVGKGDDETYRKSGLYDRVESYTQSIREILRSLLDELKPAKLAVNFSKDNPAADGLTYGMYLQLREYLDGMPYANRLISAEPIISRLRGRKTPSEVDRVKRAIVQTVDLFEEVTGMVKPGVTERQFAQFLHRRLRVHELAPAWELSGCPIVNAGPHSVAGHTAAGDIPIEPGQLYCTLTLESKPKAIALTFSECGISPRLPERRFRRTCSGPLMPSPRPSRRPPRFSSPVFAGGRSTHEREKLSPPPGIRNTSMP